MTTNTPQPHSSAPIPDWLNVLHRNLTPCYTEDRAESLPVATRGGGHATRWACDSSQFMTMFLLQHVRRSGPDDEDVKTIGIYSSHASVESAIKRLSIQPGFKDAPDGFVVDEYEIDKDHWCEGFGWE